MFCKTKLFAVASIFSLCAVQASQATDWLTLPGQYSHGPSLDRVAQYQPPEPAIAPEVSDFSRSGFRHTRSTLQYDQAADNMHIVEKWGAPIEPYEQWRFPYRPYGTPYPNWGAPYAGLGGGVVATPFGFPGRFGGLGGFGGGFGGGFNNGFGNGGFQNPYPVTPNGPYPVAPYYDGYYPSYPNKPRLNDREFFAKPVQ